jgi:hypothetical protein
MAPALIFKRAIWPNRHVIAPALLTVFGALAIWINLLMIDYGRYSAPASPLTEIGSPDVRVNNGPAWSLHQPVYVHPGDSLIVSRTINSTTSYRVFVETVFNSSDPLKDINLPVAGFDILRGLNTVTSTITMPHEMVVFSSYRDDFLAFDDRHIPKIFNDFSICVLPQGMPAPIKPTLCAQLRP